MKTKMNFDMWIPTRILFGAGELQNLHRQAMPGSKALLVISNGKSTRANGYLAATEEQLRMAGIETVVFDRIEANPLKSTVMAGAAAARGNGCDLVVALGGGSVMDAAKAIALMAVNDGDLWDYVSGGTGKGMKPAHEPLPLVAISTTAGTGSEADAWGVVTNSETHEKIGVKGAFPVLSVADAATGAGEEQSKAAPQARPAGAWPCFAEGYPRATAGGWQAPQGRRPEPPQAATSRHITPTAAGGRGYPLTERRCSP